MNKMKKWQKTSPKNKDYVVTDEYKDKIIQSARIGKRGFTILKSELDPEDLQFLKTDLHVKPQNFSIKSNAADSKPFSVFRENDKKIYIPRFYGIERYGLPKKFDISCGDSISLEFPKTLRDYQTNIVNVYMKYVDRPICDCENAFQGYGGILEVPCGRGKTVMALKIISLIQKKTLIIVHKEFLMNQWIERIEEFLPGARVGKIQGPIFDVENKDIVIGMLQTLYDKEFLLDSFSSFGMTIVDEVHRIGSEQFSKTLFKTVTPYMLGISATVDRKDNLTNVLYMFIGKKIYSEEREDEDPVVVQALQYKTNDDDFNDVLLDYAGNPKYSSMISKISNYGPRSDFILKVMKSLVNQYPESQVMVLCHNRSMLTYFYDAISHQEFATVGYYVGGMKQKDLQETETKQIVLATYAMAAEALDIKTLSILIMASPKTDITQSVGRILRVKHEHPIIVDIVDGHEMYQNQWNRRRLFYKKCNYRILQSDSNKYNNELTDWKVLFEPKDKGQKIEEEPEKIGFGKCVIDVSQFN